MKGKNPASKPTVADVHHRLTTQNEWQRIADRYASLRESPHIQRLLSAGGELHIASEGRSVEDIQTLLALGHRHFAEKYCQEMVGKWNAPPLRDAQAHLSFFGHIQRNKIRKIFQNAHAIEGIASLQTARKIAALQTELGSQRRYLLQINISQEPQKNGCLPEQAAALLAQIRAELGLDIAGVMVIPQPNTNPVPAFRRARRFADTHHLPHCAMGMSADYPLAIDCGATLIRLGRAIWQHAH